PRQKAERSRPRTCVAYVMTVFPAVSEAFTLNEMLAVEDEGLEVIPISLAQPRDPLAHGDARLLASRAMYLCRNPLKVLRANVTFVLRSPRPYLQALAYTVTGHRVSWFSLERGRSAAWKALLLFPFLVEIALRLKAKQVRHVHASLAAISGTAAIILARLLAQIFSMTGHHGDLWFYPPDDLRLRIESASFFTTVAEYNRRRLLQIYPSLNPSLVHVVRLGVPLDRFL